MLILLYHVERTRKELLSLGLIAILTRQLVFPHARMDAEHQENIVKIFYNLANDGIWISCVPYFILF